MDSSSNSLMTCFTRARAHARACTTSAVTVEFPDWEIHMVTSCAYVVRTYAKIIDGLVQILSLS